MMRGYRGILGAALLIAGLGPDLQPPVRPREPEPEPEPTTAEVDAMYAALVAAGIDAGRLAADVRGWPGEFMRRGRIELAARDLTAAGVADLDTNRAALKQATGLTYDEHAALLERVKSRASESVFTVRQLREAGVTMTPGLPDDMRVCVGKGMTFSRDGELVEITEPGDLRVGFKVNLSEPQTIDLNPMYELGAREVTLGDAAGRPLAHITLADRAVDHVSTTRPALSYDPVPRFRDQEVLRGPGLQIRDARTRARLSLRDLGDCLGIPHVELGEIERNLRPVSPDLWKLARVYLPALPEAMPPETAPMHQVGQDVRRILDRYLHPAGRCTCGAGGGDAGTCEWCVMDRRRSLREDRLTARATSAKYQQNRGEDDPGPTLEEATMLHLRDAEREHKREVRRAKQARKARRGW